MRTYEDTFSGDKIYPGKVSVAQFRPLSRPVWPMVISSNDQRLIVKLELQGKLYVRGDSKIFRFQNGKSESLFLQRKNPRRIAWTVLYRRQHKKGISEVSAPEAPTCLSPRFKHLISGVFHCFKSLFPYLQFPMQNFPPSRPIS